MRPGSRLAEASCRRQASRPLSLRDRRLAHLAPIQPHSKGHCRHFVVRVQYDYPRVGRQIISGAATKPSTERTTHGFSRPIACRSPPGEESAGRRQQLTSSVRPGGHARLAARDRSQNGPVTGETATTITGEHNPATPKTPQHEATRSRAVLPLPGRRSSLAPTEASKSATCPARRAFSAASRAFTASNSSRLGPPTIPVPTRHRALRGGPPCSAGPPR
jgi:hypothetical protein